MVRFIVLVIFVIFIECVCIITDESVYSAASLNCWEYLV